MNKTVVRPLSTKRERGQGGEEHSTTILRISLLIFLTFSKLLLYYRAAVLS
jgi:hypothetical protein